MHEDYYILLDQIRKSGQPNFINVLVSAYPLVSEDGRAPVISALGMLGGSEAKSFLRDEYARCDCEEISCAILYALGSPATRSDDDLEFFLREAIRVESNSVFGACISGALSCLDDRTAHPDDNINSLHQMLSAMIDERGIGALTLSNIKIVESVLLRASN